MSGRSFIRPEHKACAEPTLALPTTTLQFRTGANRGSRPVPRSDLDLRLQTER
jgi:hypothetical protein